MTAQLITDLSKIRTIRVISRTSAMQYRGKKGKALPQIARELGVQAVVEGSVMRAAGKVRVTAQLIEAQGERHLWAESYQRDLLEVLSLQSELAQKIGEQVRATISSADRARLASVAKVAPEVHDLVLRGQYYASKFTVPDLRKAIGYFEQAIGIDPNYAPAHSGAAIAYCNLGVAQEAPREVMPKAKAAAQRALELDETLAEAHTSLAAVFLYYEWDWPEVDRHILRALQLNPSSADAHLVYAGYFRALGNPQRALAEVRLAQELDPLSLAVQGQLLFSLLVDRQYEKAIEHSRRALKREPAFSFGYIFSAFAYTELGQMEQAVAEVQTALRMNDSAFPKIAAAHVHGAKGDREKALAILREVEALARQRYVCAYEVAHAYLKIGDKKRTYAWLEKGKQERADCMVWLKAEPWMDPLRGDRQYRELLDEIGLSDGRPGRKP